MAFPKFKTLSGGKVEWRKYILLTALGHGKWTGYERFTPLKNLKVSLSLNSELVSH